MVLITTRSDAAVLGKFDVTWFIPALIKYRGLIGEVLAASVVLQLFALATPLVFQVVTDKVLVTKGLPRSMCWRPRSSASSRSTRC